MDPTHNQAGPAEWSGVRIGPRWGRWRVPPGRIRWGTVATGVLAVLGCALVAGGTLLLKHHGERGIQVERDLQEAQTELHIQDALEWRVINGGDQLAAVPEELARSRAAVRLLVQRSTTAGVPAGYRRSAVALIDGYARAVDEELRLVSAGELAAAREYDESVVDPAFAAALTGLGGYAGRVEAAAARSRLLSDAGVLASVALSLTFTALVQGRRRRTEVQRQAERASEARYRSLIDQSSDLILVVQRPDRAGYLSPSVDHLLGTAPDGSPISYADLTAAMHATDRAALAGAVATVRPGRPSALEVRIRGTNGWRTFDLSVRDRGDDPAINGVVLTGHDITERQALQHELEHRALHDALTGLPNRALLADRFTQVLHAAARDARPAGLLLIDLDRFKEINDTLGHHYGDELLVQVGTRLTATLREVDTVARLGGDEFAVLLPQVGDLPAAIEVAEKIQQALTGGFLVDGLDLTVEASIGVVLSGLHGTDAGTLLQRADIAMYVAKQRNIAVFGYDPDLDFHSPQRLSLLADLRRALGTGELALWYQPKVRVSTGEVCGAEALVRWQHPERGLIQPDEFISLAENSGLIGPLTRHVLDLALGQARQWLDAGQPLQVAVNLSARNLLDEHLDRTVVDLLEQHQVPPYLLQLEVTESAIMSDPERAKAVLERLHERGVSIAIDDFGSGYTSLGQLKNLPISELKVDRSFVAAMQSDASNSMIVRSVIELGRDLGLRTVAEGVESAQILAHLSQYQCDVAQGYHLSRPLTADAFDQWRSTWRGQVGSSTGTGSIAQMSRQ